MSGSAGKKTSVTQADLRKLMSGQIGKSSATAGGSNSKRYKVGGRELALMEEQKRIKQAEKEKKLAKERSAAAARAATLPPTSAQPAKSILKKSNSATPTNFIHPSYVPPPPKSEVPPSATPTSSLTTSLSKQKSEEKVPESNSLSATPLTHPTSPGEDKSTDSSGASVAALPEGFFDDPVMDAKARGVAYVDKEEEEWEAFQKEIEAEASVAQNILVEDRTEATVDRQIEEIDEQIEAWQRVNRLEKMKDQVESKLKPVKKTEKEVIEDSDDSDDDTDVQDFVDWRNKC